MEGLPFLKSWHIIKSPKAVTPSKSLGWSCRPRWFIKGNGKHPSALNGKNRESFVVLGYSMEDEELVKRIEDEGENWDTEALAQLYRKYYPKVRLFALQRLRHKECAEDICQETLFSVIKAIKQKRLERPVKLSSFVYSTCYNKIQKLFRERKVGQSVDETIPDKGKEPLAKLLAQEAQEKLDKKKELVEDCIKELNQKRKNIIILTFYQKNQRQR